MDTLPEDAVDVKSLLSFVLSEKATSLRALLVDEAVNAVDILLRQGTRKVYVDLLSRLPRPPQFIQSIIPPPQETTLPFFIPISTQFSPESFRTTQTTLEKLVEYAAPKLTREEEFYASSLKELIRQSLGSDASSIANGDIITNPSASGRFILSFLSSNRGSFLQFPIFDTEITEASSRLLRILKPLSPDGSKNKSVILSTSSNDDSHADAEVTRLVSALSGLEESEDEALRNVSTEVLTKLAQRVITRLQRL